MQQIINKNVQKYTRSHNVEYFEMVSTVHYSDTATMVEYCHLLAEPWTENLTFTGTPIKQVVQSQCPMN